MKLEGYFENLYYNSELLVFSISNLHSTRIQ